MPLVNIQMAEGRTPAQKKALMAAITTAMHEHIGAPKESVRVWINEFPNTDFMAGGELLADKQARLAREAAADARRSCERHLAPGARAMTSIARDLLEQAAAQIRTAAETSTTCGPIRDIVGSETDIDAGYAIQEINTDLAIAAGRRVSGRKIGITSVAVQEQIGVDQPDFGTLFADMEFGDGVEVPAARLLQPASRSGGRTRARTRPRPGRALLRRHHPRHCLCPCRRSRSSTAGWPTGTSGSSTPLPTTPVAGLYVVGGRPVPLRKGGPAHDCDVDVDRRHRGLDRHGRSVSRSPTPRSALARRHDVGPQHPRCAPATSS